MVLDALVNAAHGVVAHVLLAWGQYVAFVTLQFPHAQAYLIGANALQGALRVHAVSSGANEPRQYWLYSYLSVLLTTFGGGWVAPLLVGKPAIPVANDLVVPFTLVAWYATYIDMGAAQLLNLLPVKLVWTVFAGLFRTHAVCNMVTVAAGALKAGPYYPTVPLVGPIVVGTCLGSMGQFLPFNKGLSAVEAGTPWPVQAAFMTAAFYHVMVNDVDGVVGRSARAVFGSYSEQTVRVIIASVQIATLLVQTLFAPNANLFTPVHKLLYMVFQVGGPAADTQGKGPTATVGWSHGTRVALERAVEAGRLLVVLLVLCGHVYLTAPPTALPASGALASALTLGKSVGTCQMFGYARSCRPFYLALENVAPDAAKGGVSLQLASYAAPAQSWYSATKGAADGPAAVWHKGISKRPVLRGEGAVAVAARLSPDGVLRVVATGKDSQQEEALWTSSSRCPASSVQAAAAAGGKSVYLTLDGATGRPVVHCADGFIVNVN